MALSERNEATSRSLIASRRAIEETQDDKEEKGIMGS